MKLDNDNSIFNMGDTSLRVLRLVDAYAFLLQQLAEFLNADLSWQNKYYQEEFYKKAYKEIIRLEEEENIKFFENFNRTYNVPEESKIGHRARTWTNALVKNGLVTSDREISIVAKNYLADILKPADRLEALMTKDRTNLLYFRQYLKLRIYAKDSRHYFYNFRFAIKFLLKHDDVPKKEFLSIIESIRPTYSADELEGIIDGYHKVKKGSLTFEDYYAQYFQSSLASQEEIALAKEMFKTSNFTDDVFKKCFSNRKSTTAQKYYKDFVLNLIDLINHKSRVAYEAIKELSNNEKIKKAFGFNQKPFEFGREETVDEFLTANQGNVLLDTDHFKIYQRFLTSKRFDLIREYSDMCFRSFQATGIFNFSSGLVNLNYKWLFKALLLQLGDERFSLSGKDNYDKYENDENSVWYADISLIDIFKITAQEVESILSRIKNEFNLKDVSSIVQYIEDRKEKEYQDFVKEQFPKSVVIEVLNAINDRNDQRVFELVTQNATIPTIFEYMLTIAWFYISKEKNYSLSKSFQLTLDGDKLPLTHRGGGAGDIEIIDKNYALLIEATLMDINNQRRAELEPVIRHSVNFKLQQMDKNVQTFFIANDLDTNVLNIFRALQFVQLQGSITRGEVDGLNIFAFTTSDIIQILEKDITDDVILGVVQQNIMQQPMYIHTDWYEPIKQQIFCK